jgi:hypothetical protein
MNQMENASETLNAPTDSSDTDVTEELSLSTTFELLKNRRRRDTLEYLLAHEGESTLSDLAEHIAALENDIEVAQLSSDQRKRVYIGLYQCHLPKMDGAGVIDFDKHRGSVVLRDEARQLVPYLEAEAKRTGDPAADVGTGTEEATAAEPDTESDTAREFGVTTFVGAAVALLVLAVMSTALPYALGGLFIGGAVGALATAVVMGFRARGRLEAALASAADSR